MSEDIWTGGCLCGAVRYEAKGPPDFTGHCYCNECRKASGSGFIPFAGFPAAAVKITGPVIIHDHPLSDGRISTRNACAKCGGLVYGGEVGKVDSHTIYAGSLDDPTRFAPRIAIFMSERAPWAAVPDGLMRFDRMPGG